MTKRKLTAKRISAVPCPTCGSAANEACVLHSKWRYRNRLTAERRLTIRSYHPGPYASAEVFYESPYSKWAVTRLYAGCLLPLGRHVELDPYYQHENNTGPRPNQQKNGAGLILWLYFPRDNK